MFTTAIIGAGIGGASAAYYLRELFGSNVSLRVFEKERLVGGRLRTVNLVGKTFEVGGSIIHSRNLLMANFVKLLDLKRIEEPGDKNRSLVVFEGVKPLFSGSSFGWLNSLKLLRRYGWDLFKIQWDCKRLLALFDRIYKHQDNGYCFTRPVSLLTSMSPSFVQLTTVSVAEYLLGRDYSRRFVDELVHGALKNNYNQSPELAHAFVGSVAMTGCIAGVFAVQGGNYLVPRGLLRQTLLPSPPRLPPSPQPSPLRKLSSPIPSLVEDCGVQCADVVKIDLIQEDPPRFSLHFSPSSGLPPEEFDYVVLAAPQNQDSHLNIPIVSSDASESLRRPFQPVHSTCVDARLKGESLGLGKVDLSRKFFILYGLDSPPLPSQLSLGDRESPPVSKSSCLFNSLANKPSVWDGKPGAPLACPNSTVWHFFSDADLQPTPVQILPRFLDNIGELSVTRWLAYPKYEPLSDPPRQLGSFCPTRGLVYLNAIENVASAMEMSAISGRNAALLIRAWATGEHNKIDPPDTLLK